MNLAKLDDDFEKLAKAPDRTRYTSPRFNHDNWPRRRRGKYKDWAVEMIFVPVEVWRIFADETQRGFYSYFGQNGSRRLYVAYYQGEEMGKFTTKARAQAYIVAKENS